MLACAWETEVNEENSVTNELREMHLAWGQVAKQATDRHKWRDLNCLCQ